MGWTLTLNGIATTLDAERAVIDKIAQFIVDLGEEVAHVWTTEFHGAGDTNTLLNNVAPAPEPPQPLGPVSPAEPTPVPADSSAAAASSDPAAPAVAADTPATDVTAGGTDASRPTGQPLTGDFAPKPADEQSTPPVTDPGASPA